MPASVASPFDPSRPGNGGGNAAGRSPFAARFLAYGEPLRAEAARAAPTVQAPPCLVASSAAQPLSLADIHPPPLPKAYLALRRIAANPLSTVTDVATIIAMDPGLAAYVLRLANSALYSQQSRAQTVSRAVAIIGLGEIEVMAAGAVLERLFDKPPRPDLLPLEAFWRHAVAVGVLARALAERVGERGGEGYFVAGLLHDLGRLVLAVAEPDLAATTLVRAATGRLPLDAAERLELGFDHAALGGRIAGKWRLPEALALAVAGHHQPSHYPESLMPAAVHAADFMANALGVRATPASGLPRIDPAVLSAFNLEDAEPGEFWGILTEGLAAMTALLTP